MKITQAEKSLRYRKRHPERQRLFKNISDAKRKGLKGLEIKYRRLLEMTLLNTCGVCGRNFRNCDRKNSECQT